MGFAWIGKGTCSNIVYGYRQATGPSMTVDRVASIDGADVACMRFSPTLLLVDCGRYRTVQYSSVIAVPLLEADLRRHLRYSTVSDLSGSDTTEGGGSD
jgi:hypothetical protein